MKNIIYIIFAFIGCSPLLGQDLVLSYEVNPVSEDQTSFSIYMQSMTDADQPIGAINFSLALPEGCVEVLDQQSIFSDAWTHYLENVKLIPQLDHSYGNWNYSHRWQYGNADPGLPTTLEVVAPARSKDMLKIMELSLKGTCADKVYLEQQHENSLNQMGDANLKSLSWTVVKAKTELEISENQWLKAYPNPVEDFLNVDLEGFEDQELWMELNSIDGKTLMVRTLDKYADKSLQLNVSHLPSGMYWLQLSPSAVESEMTMKIKVLKK
jgi:hypothetical protein